MASSLAVGSFRAVGLPGDRLTARCVFRGLRGSCLATSRWGTEVPLRPSLTCVLRVRRRVSLPPGSLPSAFHRVLHSNRPSTDALQVSTPTDRGPLRRDAATRHARSAFVVSHHLDGLLHLPLHGLVASRSRPWGSPGCRHATSLPLRRSPMPHPPEHSPPGQLVPRHRGPMPPCPCATCVRPCGTSRRSSDRESVVTTRRHRLAALVALLGFPLWRPCQPEGSPVVPRPDSRGASRRRSVRGHGRPAAAPEGGDDQDRREARPPRRPPAECASASRARARGVVRRLRRVWAGSVRRRGGSASTSARLETGAAPRVSTPLDRVARLSGTAADVARRPRAVVRPARGPRADPRVDSKVAAAPRNPLRHRV